MKHKYKTKERLIMNDTYKNLYMELKDRWINIFK